MARPSKHDGVVYQREDSNSLVDALPGPSGQRRRESTNTEDWQEAQRKLRERLQARDENTLEVVRKGEQLLSTIGRTFFWRTTPSRRFAQPKTHEANDGALKHLEDRRSEDGSWPISTPTRSRSIFVGGSSSGPGARRRVGFRELGSVEADNGSSGVSGASADAQCRREEEALSGQSLCGCRVSRFVKGLFRPHYVTWSEQQRIEFHAPDYFRNVIRIITETGLRVYKELAPMSKDQVTW